MLTSRPYAGLPDLVTLSTFLGHARHDIHQRHHLHPGDLVWQLVHMQAPFNSTEIVRTRLPRPAAPAGYQVRPVQGMHEAEQRAAVLAAAFGAPTQPERYRRLMTTPGYMPSLDIVAVEATGQFGAFALGWVDPVSKVGQFEPVGTAPTFRRLGRGRAVMVEGMRQLHAAGAERVIVIVEQAEDAARRLYRSVGMVSQWRLFLYAEEPV